MSLDSPVESPLDVARIKADFPILKHQVHGKRLVYHKMNLPSNENAWFTPGNATLSFEVEQKRFGVAICRDQNAPAPNMPSDSE